MKKIFLKFNIIIIIAFSLFFAVFAQANGILQDSEPLNPTNSNSQTGKFINETGFKTGTGSGIGDIAAAAIKTFLGLLGIIFLVLFILAGYKYMTARGNEDKVEEALSTMQRAIIGLIIVIAAYSITYVVFNSFEVGSGGSGIGRPSGG